MTEFICTPTTPWDHKDRPDQYVRHIGAREIGDQEDGWPGGDIIKKKCPNCGHSWKEELPQ